MPIIISDIEQGSEQWFKEKLGKPSASNASKIITNDGFPSKQREGYLYELAGEIITGKREESYQNANMIMGNEREDESRNFYELTNRVKVEKVGMIYKDESKKILCSPDGIVNTKIGLEMKNVLPKTQVKYLHLLKGELPSEYFSQIQFSLYVSGFEFWDFLSYVPSMRPLVVRVKPHDKFQSMLKIELDNFCTELDQIVNAIK